MVAVQKLHTHRPHRSRENKMQPAHLSCALSITQLPGGRASGSSDHALFGAIRCAAAAFCGRATFVSLALTLTTKCALSHPSFYSKNHRASSAAFTRGDAPEEWCWTFNWHLSIVRPLFFYFCEWTFLRALSRSGSRTSVGEGCAAEMDAQTKAHPQSTI